MAQIVIDTEIKEKKIISKHIYGHFAEHLGRCIYDGLWVGEDSSIPNIKGFRKDIIEALRRIKIPVLRWPGGCYADYYHWMDGIGPRDRRPSTVNTQWGNVTDDNHFGTHEFMELCELLGCEPYICGNVGSGTVQEMRQWIEYLTHDGKSQMADLRRSNGRIEPWKIKYWGVGNENWGCGGSMRAEYYTDLFLRYSTFCADYGDNKLYKIACGPAGNLPLKWLERWVEEILVRITPVSAFGFEIIHGISLHYYTFEGDLINKGSATDFSEKDWATVMRRTLHMEKYISRIKRIMETHDPQNKIGLIVDEWGAWYEVEPGTNPHFLFQQNTMRDAMVAALNFNIFNRHCDRVHMANIAQVVNVVQAPILTRGAKMILTPTFHVFDMYKVHQDALLLGMDITSETYKRKIPAIHSSASQNANGDIHISLCNINPNNSINISIKFPSINLNDKKFSATILRGDQMNAHNTFDSPKNVQPKAFDVSNFEIGGSELQFKMPSIAILVIKLE